jgi:hypothetical protein
MNHGDMPPTLPPPSRDDCEPEGLASEIRGELSAAGLPVLPPGYELQLQRASGVSVEVDEDSVWVSWEISSPLSEASQRAFVVGAYRRDNPDVLDAHPAMLHWLAVRRALTEALTAILRSLGYGVAADADVYRPGQLLVSARAPGPHWRDPAVPPLAGSAGYSPGVRVRLLTGQFAGSVTTIITGTYRLSKPGPPLRYSVEHPDGEGKLDVAPEDVTLAEDDA